MAISQKDAAKIAAAIANAFKQIAPSPSPTPAPTTIQDLQNELILKKQIIEQTLTGAEKNNALKAAEKDSLLKQKALLEDIIGKQIKSNQTSQKQVEELKKVNQQLKEQDSILDKLNKKAKDFGEGLVK